MIFIRVCVKSVAPTAAKKSFHIFKRLLNSSEMTNHISDHTNLLKKLFSEAVRSVQPSTLIKNQVKLVEGHLVVADRTFALNKPCFMVGFGKAVLSMALEIENTVGDQLERAIVTVPKGIFVKFPEFMGKSGKIQFIEGAENNIPDKEAVEGAERIKELVEMLREDDLLIVLISGGGSALLPLPKPPVTLEEKQAIIRGLSRGGASIQELNTVRKKLSSLKGGGLAKYAYPCRVVSIILSDVVGDPLDLIASGPTVYSEEESDLATEILKKYDLYENAPISIKTVLENRENESERENSVTLSGNADNRMEESVSNFIIGTNRVATGAVKKCAEEDGVQCVVFTHSVEENVDTLARIYVDLTKSFVEGSVQEMEKMLKSLPFELEENVAEQIAQLDRSRKILFVFAGEPTVQVTGTGKGGRNQQLSLAMSLELNKRGMISRNITFLSGGTDGIDGPTDAAGAIGFSGLVRSCTVSNLNPELYLKNNDAYNFFSSFHDGKFLVKTGHTGTNVMDLHLLLID